MNPRHNAVNAKVSLLIRSALGDTGFTLQSWAKAENICLSQVSQAIHESRVDARSHMIRRTLLKLAIAYCRNPKSLALLQKEIARVNKKGNER